MKKIIAFLLIATISLACSDNKNNCCTNIDTGISIKYSNQNGENLFEIPNGIAESDITVYHKINGEWKRYFRGNLDYPKGIATQQREDGTYLLIFPSTTIVDDNYSETKIEFSESDSDIIKTKIRNANSNETVTEVYYNGQLKWVTQNGERKFEIVK